MFKTALTAAALALLGGMALAQTTSRQSVTAGNMHSQLGTPAHGTMGITGMPRVQSGLGNQYDAQKGIYGSGQATKTDIVPPPTISAHTPTAATTPTY